jgi:hypothetical protein
VAVTEGWMASQDLIFQIMHVTIGRLNLAKPERNVSLMSVKLHEK